MSTKAIQTICNPQVCVIPAKKRYLQNGDQFRKQTELRVAAYCRVSTEEESQETSYTAQKNHYMTLIASRPGWQMAGIYADEGKTGTTRKGRIHFNELIADCKEGKIDYIITKSISRFARNTVDALDCVHELQRLHPPVGIYFERENIDTLNANSEMFLTFYCSMAQEESHSISENIKWSLQKNFRSGKPQINLRRMLGYDMCRDGNWIINEKEADTVRYIYNRFLEGTSANRIAKELNTNGWKTVNRKSWRADAVLYILRNEKYVGDLIMQKTYTESFLTHKAVKNTGEMPQYFRKNHHPAIVSRDIWNKTQELLTYRQNGRTHLTKKIETDEGETEIAVDPKWKTTQEAYAMQAEYHAGRGCPVSPFSSLHCGNCGAKMKRMSYNVYLKDYQDERSHVGKEVSPEEIDYADCYTFSYGIWKCPGSKKGSGERNVRCKGQCKGNTLPEISIKQSFMELMYRLKRDISCNGERADIVASFNQVYAALCCKESNDGFIQQKINLLEMEIEELERNYEMTLDRMNTVDYASSIQLGNTVMESSGNVYARLAEDIKKCLEERQGERNRLLEERGVAYRMKENFDAFLAVLDTLPAESLGETVPDLFTFDEHMFRTFILSMEAFGDEICYRTSFGLILTSAGNSRPIKSYVGYRQVMKDGTVNIIEKMEQLSTGKIQHHWKPRRAKTRAMGKE